MAALLHCIVVDIENSRLKDHIRDWNTNMKVDMYNHFKNKFKEEREKREELYHNIWNVLENEAIEEDFVICGKCDLFTHRSEATEVQSSDINSHCIIYDNHFRCEDCLEVEQ